VSSEEVTRTSEEAAALYAPTGLATRPPHVRSALDVPAVMRCVLVAAVPCVAMALYNTGYQANLAVSIASASPSGWRDRIVQTLSAGYAPTDPWSCVLHGALYFVPLLLVSLLAGGVVERVFARLRGRAPDHVALPVIGLLFTLCLPPSLPLWKAAVGCAAGIAFGKEIFGGLGRNFVNPALAGLALLYFAYPGSVTGDVWTAVDGYSGATPLAAAGEGGLRATDATGLSWTAAFLGRIPGAMGATSALACLMGLAVLLYSGVASWRILAGGLLGLAGGVWIVRWLGVDAPISELPWHWHAVTGGFAFGLVFLATDPVTAAVTNPGRWLYGALIGILVAVIRIANPAHREGVLLAILLGNITAPLLDQLVARVQMRRKKPADAR
jgi:Na+-transporting NADH:ubiquinone oxidoreductase subunit B